MATDPTWPQQAQRLMERLVADRGAPAAFDAVLCHGVLMYIPDPGPLLHLVAVRG